MEEKVSAKASAKVVKSGKKEFKALVGFNTSDEKRFEEGDTVSGVKAEDMEALLEMGAVAEVG